MSSEVLAALSSAALLLLWAWTGYHLIVLALGWPHSKASLRKPFDLGSLRNPVDLPSVTVIVAAKDEENVIRTTLEQVAALRYPQDRLEIIIAEDGSRDHTREICESFTAAHPGVLFLREDVSGGKAAALNRAVRRATGEILLFLDADTRFEGDLLLRAAKFFHDHPDFDVAQTLIDTYNGHQNLVAKLDRYETVVWYRGILAGKDRLDLFAPLCGTGMFIKRRLLDEVGEWDVESLAEDLDMAVRLTAKGAKIRVLPTRVWRQPPYSIRDFIGQRKRWWGGALQALRCAAGEWRNAKMPRRVRMDMLLHLISPVMFVLGTVYLLLIALLSPVSPSVSGLAAATLMGILTSQFILLGLVVAHSIAHRSARDLNLVPGIYLYWAMQLYAVLAVILALALDRRPPWRVTAKQRVRMGAKGPWAIVEPPVLPSAAAPQSHGADTQAVPLGSSDPDPRAPDAEADLGREVEAPLPRTGDLTR